MRTSLSGLRAWRILANVRFIQRGLGFGETHYEPYANIVFRFMGLAYLGEREFYIAGSKFW